jgi:Skp family chaperone for outer membrane proteins
MTRITRAAFQFSLSAILVLVLAFSSMAKQNEEKGNGIGSDDRTSSAEAVRGRVAQSESRDETKDRDEKALERMDKARHRDEMKTEETSPQGLEKQQEKKMEQERTEKDKGSEQGQKMREEHSRKWWKFWE